MLQKITNLILKRPMKIVFVGLVLFLILLAGALQVTLETGNDTLIQTDTDEYIDNYEYQEEFGSDPIIVIYKGDGYEELFTVENIALMSALEDELSNYDEIYAINSPVSIVKQFAAEQANMFEEGLFEVSNGLEDVSVSLDTIATSIASGNTDDIEATIDQLNTAINGMIDGQENLSIGVTGLLTSYASFATQLTAIADSIDLVIADIAGDPALDNQEADLTAANDLLRAMVIQMDAVATSGDPLPDIADNTVLGLENILLGLQGMIADQTIAADQMQALGTNIATIATNLHMMAVNLEMIYDNFNILEPGIPTDQATLDMMVYDETGTIRSMFESLTIDESYMMFLVVLQGEVDDDVKTDIVDSINGLIDEQGITDKTLVSGKPVLDLSIKTEMMGSMQVMMALSAVIMVGVLLVVFRVKWSLLPLMIILFAVLATIGLMGWLSIGLTMVSMAVFPVLIGLGIDYSIQFQSRYSEEMAGGIDNE